MPSIEFVIPGDPDTLTGGYIYDREIAAALNAAGWPTNVRQIGASTYEPATRAAAAQLLNALPSGCNVVIDGLALAGLADVCTVQKTRHTLVALLHHPAALETGLEAALAARIAADELRALESMHAIVCTSHWTARLVADSGIAANRIHVVEPGVRAMAQACDVRATRRRPAEAHENGLRLLCVATLTPRKGHDVLIEALASLEDLPWELECIGSVVRAPHCAARIVEMIDAKGLAPRIRLRGEVSDTELASAYRRADLFVLASRLEGFGMVLSEARAAALPIVAASGGAVSETLAGAAAVTVEPNDVPALSRALRNVAADRQHWLELSAAAVTAAAIGNLQPREWSAAAGELIACLETTASL
jgi:glycosyltransferase involved in cell wall biosynthesis